MRNKTRPRHYPSESSGLIKRQSCLQFFVLHPFRLHYFILIRNFTVIAGDIDLLIPGLFNDYFQPH